MSWNQNPPGGQPGGFGGDPGFGGQGTTPPGGQGYPGQQGGFGGQPPQGGFGGQPPQGGFGGQPPQGGFGGQPPPGGFGGQQGFGAGFPPGPTGQPPKKKSKGMLIGIAVAAVAVVALAGLLIMLLTGGDDDPLPPPPPPPPTAAPTPTAGPTTQQPTTGPTTQAPAPGGAIQFSNGLSVTPPSGWTVAEQDADSVLLRDASGRAVIVSAGRTDDVRGGVTGIIDRLTASGSDVQKTDVRTPEHPTLNIATQSAVMTVASGGGSTRLGIYSVVSSRKSDQVGFAAAALAPAADYRDEAFTGQVDEIVGSLLASQLAGG